MKSSIRNYCDKRISEFDLIPESRKKVLLQLSAYLRYKETDPIDLLFVCADNSSVSIFSQVWAKVAGNFYGYPNVETHSAGIRQSNLAANIVYTLSSLGFDLFVVGDEENSKHYFVFDQRKNTCICRSKTLYHYSLPTKEFGVISNHIEADKIIENLKGAELRLLMPYTDPKFSDVSPIAQQEYHNCSNEIAREMLFAFSKI